jgi:RNA-directed DNA polymerase
MRLINILRGRGRRYGRWADDFLILVKPERAANCVINGIVKYLEEELNLLMNKEKSEVRRSKTSLFLGFKSSVEGFV